MAKGFTQVECIGFFFTFSNVSKITTLRLIFTIAYSLNLYLHQSGVHNAFLHGDLDEEFYMSLPQGINPSHPNQVCKLLKSLYGLK